MIAAGDFAGRSGETLVLYTRGAIPAGRVLVAGLGEAAKFDLRAARNAAATAARKARDLGVKTAATIVHGRESADWTRRPRRPRWPKARNWASTASGLPLEAAQGLEA